MERIWTGRLIAMGLTFAGLMTSCVTLPQATVPEPAGTEQEAVVDAGAEQERESATAMMEAEETGEVPEEVGFHPATDVPHFVYAGAGLKMECESFFLEHAEAQEDESASGKYAVQFLDVDARATAQVRLAPGDYECLVAEKAFYTEQSAFFVSIDGEAHRVYPSNPPLGTWELTTRAVFSIHVAEEAVLDLCISADQTGMYLDYLQLVRRDTAEDPEQ